MAQRNANSFSTTIQEIEDIGRVLADIEIVDLVQNSLEESPHTVLDMETVNITYNNLLGIPPDRSENFKRYLKQLIKENVSQIVFTRPPVRNESERLCSLQAHSSAIEKTFKNSWENYTNIFEAAKLIRKDLIKQEKWQFSGSFDGLHVPQSLVAMLQWILIGPKQEMDIAGRKKEKLNHSIA